MNIKSKSQKLRQDMTPAEKVIWFQLRDRRFYGWKFRRQHCIENYIVDFYCAENKLVIEIDGGQHDLQKKQDDKRTALLESLGYDVIRFWNNDVLQNLEGVLSVIKEHLGTPHPNPLCPYRVSPQKNLERGDKLIILVNKFLCFGRSNKLSKIKWRNK